MGAAVYFIGFLNEQPSDKYLFEVKMKQLFDSNVEIITHIQKAEVQSSSVELNKYSKDIEQVVKLLEKDGWIFKGEGIGIDTYFLDFNNRINIINPMWGGSYDLKGRRVDLNKYNVYVVAYNYNNRGDDLCD